MRIHLSAQSTIAIGTRQESTKNPPRTIQVQFPFGTVKVRGMSFKGLRMRLSPPISRFAYELCKGEVFK
jgi:hypothetical protein